MPSFGSPRGDVLYLVVCAAEPARATPGLVAALQGDGWDVCVVTTPSARRWAHVDALAELTGHDVRTDMRGPDDPPFEPFGDALVVAPATCNTLNKLAAGINDTLALGLTNEAIGTPGVPVVVVPWCGPALSAHPAHARSLTLLANAGVRCVAVDDAATPTALVEAVREALDHPARKT
jgi:phosphopantothenoylcysteine synthetase/decarboxylase